LGEIIDVRKKQDNFGNAREVRNIFDEAVKFQAKRLSSLSSVTDNEYLKILSVDIPD
jgi:hypothetical protein